MKSNIFWVRSSSALIPALGFVLTNLSVTRIAHQNLYAKKIKKVIVHPDSTSYCCLEEQTPHMGQLPNRGTANRTLKSSAFDNVPLPFASPMACKSLTEMRPVSRKRRNFDIAASGLTIGRLAFGDRAVSPAAGDASGSRSSKSSFRVPCRCVWPGLTGEPREALADGEEEGLRSGMRVSSGELIDRFEPGEPLPRRSGFGIELAALARTSELMAWLPAVLGGMYQ